MHICTHELELVKWLRKRKNSWAPDKSLGMHVGVDEWLGNC